MKNIFLSLIEMGYLTLQFPRELPVYMNRLPNVRILESIVLFMASLSFSTGIYRMRDYYSPSYLIHISILTSAVYFFLSIYFIFVSSYFDTTVSSKKAIVNPGKAHQGRSILYLSSFPFWFFHPAIMLLNAVNAPQLFILPAFLLILFWSIIIQSRGLQYLYELTWKDFLKNYILSSGIALIFPIVSVSSLVVLGILS